VGDRTSKRRYSLLKEKATGALPSTTNEEFNMLKLNTTNNTTVINDLIDAGLGFRVSATDAAFGEDGELSSCRTVEDTRYRPGGAEQVTWDNAALRWVVTDPDPEVETLCGEGIEDGALTDDDGLDFDLFESVGCAAFLSPSRRQGGTGPRRWDHEWDSHRSAALGDKLLLSKRDRLWDDEGKHVPEHHEMAYYAWARRARAVRLARYLDRQPRSRRKDILRRIWNRYVESIKVCARRDEWYLLLLTKAQMQWLSKRSRR